MAEDEPIDIELDARSTIAKPALELTKRAPRRATLDAKSAIGGLLFAAGAPEVELAERHAQVNYLDPRSIEPCFAKVGALPDCAPGLRHPPWAVDTTSAYTPQRYDRGMDDQSSASVVFGSRVRDRRLELELSQETVAKLAQMNVSNYGKVERGFGNPTLLTLVRIAVVLGTDPGTFLTGLGAESLPAAPATYTAADFIAAREAATNNADPSGQK